MSFLPILVVVIFCTPIISYGAGDYLSIINGVYFRTSGSLGLLSANFNFYSSKCEFDENFVYFEDFDAGSGTWDKIGFGVSTYPAETTLKSVSTDKITYSVYTQNFISITKIYVGSKGLPQSVKGCYNFEYNPSEKDLSIYVSHQSVKTRNVEVLWSNESIEVQSIQTSSRDMTNQYFLQGNLIGGILAIMIVSMGVPITFGGITLAIFIPLYIRYQSITPPSIILFLLFGLIKTMIPTPILGFSTLIMAISAGNLIYKIVIKRRET